MITNYGSNVRVGAITSLPAVTLGSSAVVGGPIVSGGTVTGAPAGSQVSQNQTLSVTQYSWSISVPSSTTDVILDSGSRTLAPGSYNNVTANGGTLTLGPGTYYINNLALQSGSQLVVSDATAPVYVYVQSSLSFRTKLTSTSENFLLGYSGSNATALETTFAGTFIAPNASVRLAVGNTSHLGQFFAKSLLLDPGVKVTLKPFGHWDSLGISDPQLVATTENALVPLLGAPGTLSLLQAVQTDFGSVLTNYQNSLLRVAILAAQNADLFGDQTALSSAQRARLATLKSQIMAEPATSAIAAAGTALLNDPAALASVLSQAAARASQSYPSPPAAPAQACGAPAPATFSTLATFQANTLAASRTASTLLASPDGAALLTANAQNPYAAAAQLSASQLANLSTSGALPRFDLGGFVKGALEVAAGVAAIAVTVASGGTAGIVIAGIVAGGIAVGGGVYDADVALNTDAPTDISCPGTAPVCDSTKPCPSGAYCSFSCCVEDAAGSSKHALISAGFEVCFSSTDCPANQDCQSGCCAATVPR
ncbi:MAG: hypothetical protein QM756_08550 [Polyangiaceae bacterium]